MNGSTNFQSFSNLSQGTDTLFKFKGTETMLKSCSEEYNENDGSVFPEGEESEYNDADRELNQELSVDKNAIRDSETQNHLQSVGESHIQEHKIRSSTAVEETECRKFTKLMYDPKVSQQKRREAALEWQRKRRDDILDKIRQLEGDSAYSDSEPEESVDFVKLVKVNEPSKEPVLLEEKEYETVEQMDTASGSASNRNTSKHWNRKIHRRDGQRRLPPCRVMLSEWLIQKPEDFEENWLGLFCPVGKRCLVVASRGKTRVYSRTDDCIGLYQSLLPGGRKANYRDSTHNRSRGVTILDCIWSIDTHKFYVLDLVCWNSHSCNNCDTEYRQFFLNSKFSENPELLESTALNPFPFIPLPIFSCEQMPEIVMSSLPIFPEKVDGVLLFHKETFYIPETNPLCLWVYLTDVERRLSFSVSPELLDRQKKHRKRKESTSNNKSMELDDHL